jgi:tetratricopeptide (TPR) repeat protein
MATLRLTQSALPDGVAYTHTMARLGNHHHGEYQHGRQQVMASLKAEEANLLHARGLARQAGRWGEVVGCTQGLRVLYHISAAARSGPAWSRRSRPMSPTRPPGRPASTPKSSGDLVTDYLIGLLGAARDWAAGERLGRERLAHYEARAEYNIGRAYLDIPEVCDLDRAERSYLRSLELRDENDRNGRSAVVSQLGTVALRRFQQAYRTGAPADVQAGYVTTAARRYEEALDMLPPDAAVSRAITLTLLGNVYVDAGADARELIEDLQNHA